MSFLTYFSKQARRPEGLFGRIVMKLVFDLGNNTINNFVYDLMAVQTDDRIIEIGSGTGKLLNMMAQRIERGIVEGVDFSNEMVSLSNKRNKKNISKGKVKIVEGDFENMHYEKNSYSKACSVNTIYFWNSPISTAQKIAEILEPTGKLILAFEDIDQLKERKLDQNVFQLYSTEDVKSLLVKAGFSKNVEIVSKKKRDLIFHCAVAHK